MGKVMVVAAMSVDGFIADPSDGVGPLFDFYGNGPVATAPGDPERTFHVTPQTAEYLEGWRNVGACVIGRRLFDITDGWGGRPAAGDHVFVVTHSAPTGWAFAADAPFTFVTDGVRSAVEQARAFAGDRDVSVSAGDIGRQALDEGLVDEVVLNVAPAVFGRGVRFFGEIAKPPLLLENPTVVEGDRVIHLTYPVRK